MERLKYFCRSQCVLAFALLLAHLHVSTQKFHHAFQNQAVVVRASFVSRRAIYHCKENTINLREKLARKKTIKYDRNRPVSTSKRAFCVFRNAPIVEDRFGVSIPRFLSLASRQEAQQCPHQIVVTTNINSYHNNMVQVS